MRVMRVLIPVLLPVILVPKLRLRNPSPTPEVKRKNLAVVVVRKPKASASINGLTETTLVKWNLHTVLTTGLTRRILKALGLLVEFFDDPKVSGILALLMLPRTLVRTIADGQIEPTIHKFPVFPSVIGLIAPFRESTIGLTATTLGL
jgi:hypothetical protein